MGREWKLLSPEEKAVYIQRARERKEGNIVLNHKEKRRLATQLFGNLQAVVCYMLGPLGVFTVPMHTTTSIQYMKVALFIGSKDQITVQTNCDDYLVYICCTCTFIRSLL